MSSIHVPGGQDQVRGAVQAVSHLHPVGASHSRDTRILEVQRVQPELADQVVGLQVVLAGPEVHARARHLAHQDPVVIICKKETNNSNTIYVTCYAKVGSKHLESVIFT